MANIISTIFLLLIITSKCYGSDLPNTEIPKVDFFQAMKHADEFKQEVAENDPTWLALKNLYDMHILKQQEYSNEQRIPKIIHQIWIGSPLPEKYKPIIETWKKNHPDWQHILWTDKDIEQLNLVNKDKYQASKNMGEKSDIAKYEIIYRFGGLYVDTDFECLKPMDAFHHCCDFYSSVAYQKDVVLYAALFAGKAGNPILKKCVDHIKNTKVGLSDPTSIVNNTGPGLITRCLKESLPALTDKTVIFPVTFFYPWPGKYRFENDRKSIEQWLRPESFAIHHWHTSWQRTFN